LNESFGPERTRFRTRFGFGVFRVVIWFGPYVFQVDSTFAQSVSFLEIGSWALFFGICRILFCRFGVRRFKGRRIFLLCIANLIFSLG
jgi:hypothetical protein